MLNCKINRQKVNVRCDTRASDASRDVKWTGKCKAECSRLRPNQKPTPGLWTVAGFAVTLTTYVGKIAFTWREAVHSTNDHWPKSLYVRRCRLYRPIVFGMATTDCKFWSWRHTLNSCSQLTAASACHRRSDSMAPKGHASVGEPNKQMLSDRLMTTCHFAIRFA